MICARAWTLREETSPVAKPTLPHNQLPHDAVKLALTKSIENGTFANNGDIRAISLYNMFSESYKQRTGQTGTDRYQARRLERNMKGYDIKVKRRNEQDSDTRSEITTNARGPQVGKHRK